ncbi:calcium ion transporter [Ephemerocybe angulata]|uniref:Vacuolar calcium ion transporter n=1 Tax=Ephemerocybe angulata TaxID=980116 RepID=A0A8H6M5G5_9AGAR|nr:calcium ion transporter [Tulosesus angulatus]
MVESFVSSSSNVHANSNALAPHSTAVVADDDDEPPSSGPRHNRDAQVTLGSQELPFEPSDARFPPIKTRDTLYISEGDDPSRVLGRTDTLTTLDVDLEKQEKVEHVSQPRIGGRTGRNLLKPVRLSRADRIRALFTPSRDIGPRPTYLQSFKAIALYNYLNILLVFIPVSWALHFTHQSPTLIFVFSCLAIIPLAALLGLGTEQIALRTSQSVGGLLNATLGNVVEMIIAGIALKECELELVQSSLLGGLLSNLLLVLGCAFIVGGIHFPQQEFQPMVAQLNSSLLIVSVISLIIPVSFHLYLEDKLTPGTEVSVLLQMSRGSAVILILVYFAYLVFQFYSHNHLFLDTVQTEVSSSHSSRSSKSSALSRQSTISDTLRQNNGSMTSVASSSSSSSMSSFGHEQLKLNIPVAVGLLITITALTYVTAESLVDSLEGLVHDHPNISKEWITLIVIPIISNAAEHATAVIVARKGKFDLAMSVAVGSCIQISLFVIPLLVLVAWGMDKPLMLLFDPLETIILFFSVLVVKFSIEDGRSHWMSGLALISVYIIIALSFWNFPDPTRLFQGLPLSSICSV